MPEDNKETVYIRGVQFQKDKDLFCTFICKDEEFFESVKEYIIANINTRNTRVSNLDRNGFGDYRLILRKVE